MEYLRPVESLGMFQKRHTKKDDSPSCSDFPKDELVRLPVSFFSPSKSAARIKQEDETIDSPPNSKNKVGAKREEKMATKATKRCSSANLRKSWNERIQECRNYRQVHGHCKIPTNYKNDKALGIWVQETRRNVKLLMEGKPPRRKLTNEQIEELKDVGFDWGKFQPDWSKMPETESSWQRRLDALKAYYEEHGNFDIPYNEDENAPQTLDDLGRWARIQRHQYNLRQTKRKTTLTAARVKALSAIGFDWKGPRTL